MSSVSTRTLVLRALGELLPHKAIPPTSLELSLALGCTSEELNNAFIETFALPTDETLHYLSSEYLAKTISPLTGRQDVTLTYSRRQEAKEYVFRYNFYETYAGELMLASTERGLCVSLFTFMDRSGALERIEQEFHPKVLIQSTGAFHEEALCHLTSLGKRASLPPLHLFGTPFQCGVWEAMLRIPSGRCCHYQDLATLVGKPRGAQAVGTAVGANPLAPFIPCHRVLPRTDTLGDYYWGSALKALVLLPELISSPLC